MLAVCVVRRPLKGVPPAGVGGGGGPGRRSGGEWDKTPVEFGLIGLLAALYPIHVVWFYMILKVPRLVWVVVFVLVLVLVLA